MKSLLIYSLLVFIVAELGIFNTAHAVTVTLGNQDFKDGTILDGVSAFNNQSGDEPAPFDQFYGSDFSSPFTAEWVFNYTSQAVSAATLTLGIFDHDSWKEGDQVDFFTVDSIDISSLLNAQFENRGGLQAEYNIYTIDLPSSVFSDLSDGTAQCYLALDSTNGAGLDFVTLTVVPEPATMALLGLGGLVLRKRRKV